MAKFPKIALVVPNLLDGGGVPAVAHFLSQIIKNSDKYDIKVISLSTSSDDSNSALILKPWTFFRGPTVSSDYWHGESFVAVGAWAGELEFMRYQNRKILTDAISDCDLIQVVCGSPAWANAFLGQGKPISLQCATLAKVERRRRDANPIGISGQIRKWMTVLTDYYDRRSIRGVNAIQVENPWMLDYCKKITASANVDLRYAPPGIDADLFKPIPDRLSGNDPYILCVARLSDPRKNVELLLEAYALLPLNILDRYRLKLAGSSGPPEHFWQRAQQLGLTDRIDYVVKPTHQELVSLYQHAYVFALSSDEEGLGVVILEAMACGVPVVSTRSGGPDGIIEDGKDGFLTPLDDVEALSNRILLLASSSELNRRMGEEARNTIEMRYTTHAAKQQFLDTWERLLAKRN